MNPSTENQLLQLDAQRKDPNIESPLDLADCSQKIGDILPARRAGIFSQIGA